MATELPKIIRSLEQVSTGYTVFEPNQVLSEKHLNGLTSYLDDQDRLTRIELLGVGIAGGLRVRVEGGKVRVGRGVGVTTDGDLLMLETDTTFDRFKPYGESAPAYAPFEDSTGAPRKLFELVREGESDVIAQPLAAAPAPLAGMAVVMLMESCRKDPDLCTGTDCDNLGQDAIHTTRLLLASAADASAMWARLATDGIAARGLPVLAADRPQFSGAIQNLAALSAVYRASCGNIHAQLVAAFPHLHELLSEFTMDLFHADPAPGWIAALDAQRVLFARREAGIQYYYGFLKDLVETWNALVDTLCDHDAVLCPDKLAFPKHLLLGSLSNPRELRTDFYPSPLTCRDATAHEHARFLAGKLHVLVNAFRPSADTDAAIAITPSRAEPEPLEARAIPFYYAFVNEFPIHAAWNYRASSRGGERRLLGYRAGEYGGTPEALRPLDFQVGRHDFLRIEGHQGQPVGAVMKKLKSEIAIRNLPIAVRAVLLGTLRKHIVIKPPIRYTDLHRLHQLLRKHVSTQLDDVAEFNVAFTKGIVEAATRAGSLIPGTMDSVGTAEMARARQATVQKGVEKARAALQATSYTDYRQRLGQAAGSFHGDYSSAVSAVAEFKRKFGDLARTDFSTPFDSLVTSHHRAWLDWLDAILDRREEREDERLRFENFLKEHRGIEHFAGTPPGGTFVVVYGPDGIVVADFSLPYYAPEVAEDDAGEDALPTPPLKPPISVTDGVRILPPFDVVLASGLDDFRRKIQPEWEKAVAIQKDYFDFFRHSVDALSKFAVAPNLTNITVGGPDLKFGDSLLGMLAGEVEDKRNQVEKLKDMLLDPNLPATTRKKAKEMLNTAEKELGGGIADVTRHLAQTGAEFGPDSDGGKAMGILTRGMGSVSTGAVRTALGEDLKKTAETVSASGAAPAVAVGNAITTLIQVGGFR